MATVGPNKVAFVGSRSSQCKEIQDAAATNVDNSSGMTHYVRLMRPHEWIKNLVVLAGPIFAARLTDPRGLLAFVAFCLVSSAGYAINDVLDRDADKAHPQKCGRPIASGAVSPGGAVSFGLALLALALLTTLFCRAP